MLSAKKLAVKEGSSKTHYLNLVWVKGRHMFKKGNCANSVHLRQSRKLWAIFFLGIIISIFYMINMKIKFDQDQLYQKGNLLAAHSIWVHYGNLSSGGLGHVPGSLTTLFVAVPLMIWYSPYSPLILIFLLHIIAYFLLDKIIIQSFHDFNARIIFAIIYWTNPWRASEAFLWNPCYLFFCTALHIWSAFKMKEDKKIWPTLIHVFSIGIAGQLHNSALILVFLSLFLYWRKIIKIHWPAAVSGIIIVLISLIPFFIYILDGRMTFPGDSESFFARGLLSGAMFKGILYWIRYGTFFFPRTIFSYTTFQWLTEDESLEQILQIIWAAIKYPIGIGTFIYAFRANLDFFKSIRRIIFDRNRFQKDAHTWPMLYSGGAFISLVAAAALSPVVLTHWHLLIVFFPALYPVFLSILKHSANNPKRWRYIFSFIIIYFSLVNIMTSHGSRYFDASKDNPGLHKAFFKRVNTGVYSPKRSPKNSFKKR